MLGAVLLFDRPASRSSGAMSPAGDRLAGLAILATLAVVLLWPSRGSRRFLVPGWTFLLPLARSALAQVARAAIDVGTTAAALHVLLPPDVAPGFASFTILFVAAMVAGMISHAPGVLEAMILPGLGAGTRPCRDHPGAVPAGLSRPARCPWHPRAAGLRDPSHPPDPDGHRGAQPFHPARRGAPGRRHPGPFRRRGAAALGSRPRAAAWTGPRMWCRRHSSRPRTFCPA